MVVYVNKLGLTYCNSVTKSTDHNIELHTVMVTCYSYDYDYSYSYAYNYYNSRTVTSKVTVQRCGHNYDCNLWYISVNVGLQLQLTVILGFPEQVVGPSWLRKKEEVIGHLYDLWSF